MKKEDLRAGEATNNGLHNITINMVLTNYSGEKMK
jgi:hypothetical protein